MSRIDYCKHIIHFTKHLPLSDEVRGNENERAYKRFKKIINEGFLNCGTGMIKGNHCCICFTEAPATCLKNGNKFNPKYFERYSPFGFEFSKKYIFSEGGRPVIYSTDKEYQEKNEKFNWRHVRYDPCETDKGIDFTWEREWRIKTNKLKLDPNEVKLVLPNQDWIGRFIKEHEQEFHNNDCPECNCTRHATVYKYDEYYSEAKYEELSGTCPRSNKFPWIFINMNGKLPMQSNPHNTTLAYIQELMKKVQTKIDTTPTR